MDVGDEWGNEVVEEFMAYPHVEIVEEGMREGMQIESASIPVTEKVELIDRLSDTGLKTIVVGAFVSPKWTPQMAKVGEVVRGFSPRQGVRYTAVALNARGRERLREYSPPLEAQYGGLAWPRTLVHLCDVFVQRNTRRTQADEVEGWGHIIDNAVQAGEREAGVALNAAWGSNWLGKFGLEYQVEMIGRQYDAWSQAGIIVDRVWLGDPMAWNVPSDVAALIGEIRRRWPGIRTFHLHLHNARGSALTSAYAALDSLDAEHTLILDSSIGGMGGCPYCGHGRATRMIPTEDLVDLLEELGISTGVDIEKLIEVVLRAEQVVGHELWGHLSKAGRRPRGSQRYPMDLPMIETFDQAQHFRLGPSAYASAPTPPWGGPIRSVMRSEE